MEVNIKYSFTQHFIKNIGLKRENHSNIRDLLLEQLNSVPTLLF